MVQKPLVSIRCMVYNHEPYLRQCLEGFVMQKTTFPFEAIVHDDASTDGSAAIIREYAEKYPDIIKPIYEAENQYSKSDGSIDRIMDAAIHPDAKYIALCEGDDYWIDPFKLQKQVDFLEKHSDYVLCHSDSNILLQKSGKFLLHANSTYHNETSKDVFKEILMGRYVIRTATVVVRKYNMLQSQESDKIVFQSDYFKMGDTPLWLELIQQGKFHYFPEVMTVYRSSKGTVSNPKSLLNYYRFQVSIYELRLYYLKKYAVTDIEVINFIQKLYLKNLFRLRCFDKCYKSPDFLDLSFLVERKLNILLRYIMRLYMYLYKMIRG